MIEHDDAHLLSGAYALDAVTPEEARLVESAMRDSEELRSEVVGLTDTAVALGLGLRAVPPPPALRASILDAIETLPQEAPAVAGPEAARPMPSGAHLVGRRRRRLRPMTLLAVAAAAFLLFGGQFLLQRTLLEPQSEYVAITTASDLRTDTANVAGGGTVKVSWSRSEHRTAVVLNGVRVPKGRVLQLWSMRDGTITSAGLYEDGQRYALISGTPRPGELLAVSVEPEGGSTQPTTKPIVAVRLGA